MRVRAQEIINGVDSIMSIDNLDSILTLSVDDAIQLALRKSANQRLEPVWYEKIMAKLGDKEKEVFTLGLASSGIKVMPKASTSKKANFNIEKLKKHFQDLVAEQGFISEDDYHEAMWDKKINGNVPDKVVGEINAWLMQSMIPLKKNKPKCDVTPAYRKKVTDQVKHPDVKKFKASVEVPVNLSDEDKNVISAFTEKRSDASKRLISTGWRLEMPLPSKTARVPAIAFWDNENEDNIIAAPLKNNGIALNNYSKLVINQLKEYAPHVKIKGATRKHAWLPIEKDDAKAIKNFIDHKSGSGANVFSNGKELRVATEDHEAVVATWQGERLLTNSPETQFEDVVLSWLFRWQQKVAVYLQPVIAFLEGKAQATDFAMEQSELERFIMSWGSKLKNVKEWLRKVRQATDISELDKIWESVWRIKEDIAVDVTPSKHEYKEYIDLGGDDDDTPLDLAAGMGGAEGDEDVDKFQQAYNAVGANVEKMVGWLKSNKGVDMTAKSELKNAIKDWLDHHKKTAQEDISDVGTLLDKFLKDPYLSKEFSETYEELQSQGFSDKEIVDTFVDILSEFREKLLSQVTKKGASEGAIDSDALLDFIAKDRHLFSNFHRTYERLHVQGQSNDIIEAFFENMIKELLGDVAPQTLNATVVEVAEQLVDIFQENTDDDKELKVGLVDTTEPYRREVIKN